MVNNELRKMTGFFLQRIREFATMSLQLRIVLPFAAALLWLSAPSMAADYEPPIFVESGPEYVPVEVGSGWYLRGDVTYNANRPAYEFSLFGQDSKNNRFGGELGFGYYFTDYLRSDLTIGLVSSDKFDYEDNAGNAVWAKNHVWSGLANGYVDLGTFAGFTPYIGAGIGVMSSNAKIGVDTPTDDFEWRNRQTNFAYALNAGLGYRVSPNTSIDLSYRFLSSPDMQYVDLNSLATRKGVDYHQVKLGVRYDLW